MVTLEDLEASLNSLSALMAADPVPHKPASAESQQPQPRLDGAPPQPPNLGAVLQQLHAKANPNSESGPASSSEPGAGGGAHAAAGDALSKMLMARRPPPGAEQAGGNARTNENILPRKPRPRPAGKDTKLRALYWNKLPDADIESTIWHKVDDTKAMVKLLTCHNKLHTFKLRLLQGEIDKDVLETSFVATNFPEVAHLGATATDQQKVVYLFDSKRQQLAGVLLTRLNMTADEVKAALIALDTTRELPCYCSGACALVPIE